MQRARLGFSSFLIRYIRVILEKANRKGAKAQKFTNTMRYKKPAIPLPVKPAVHGFPLRAVASILTPYPSPQVERGASSSLLPRGEGIGMRAGAFAVMNCSFKGDWNPAQKSERCDTIRTKFGIHMKFRSLHCLHAKLM